MTAHRKVSPIFYSKASPAMQCRIESSRGGFSLVETLLVVVVIALVITIAFPFYGFLRDRAGFAACVGNLRVIGVGLNGYIQDHSEVWPQVPEGLLGNEIEEAKWWVETLKPYNVAQKHLACPSDELAWEHGNDRHPDFVGSYVFTLFDEFPSTAFHWNQPWVLERGSFHGSKTGPNMLMPDGSIQQGVSMLTPPR